MIVDMEKKKEPIQEYKNATKPMSLEECIEVLRDISRQNREHAALGRKYLQGLYEELGAANKEEFDKKYPPYIELITR